MPLKTISITVILAGLVGLSNADERIVDTPVYSKDPMTGFCYRFFDFTGWTLGVGKDVDGEEGAESPCFCGSTMRLPENIRGFPLRFIADATFSGCSNVTEVVIPSGVRFVRADAFGAYVSLERFSAVSDNDGLCSQDGLLFTEGMQLIACPPKASPVIPKGTKGVAGGVFRRRNDLKRLVVPAGVAKLDPGSFADCLSLAEVVLPEGPLVIEAGAFDGCTNLVSVSASSDVVPENGLEAFDGTPFSVPRRWVDPTSGLEWSYLSYGSFATVVGVDSSDFEYRSVSVPETLGGLPVYGVDADALIGLTNLTEVLLPSTLRRFSQTATGLKVEKISVDPCNERLCAKDGALMDCRGKRLLWVVPNRDVKIPPGTREIAPRAYCQNRHLRDLIVPEGVEMIGEEAFGCRHLKSVSLPTTIREVRRRAFGVSAPPPTLTIPRSVREAVCPGLLFSHARISWVGEESESMPLPDVDRSDPSQVPALARGGDVSWMIYMDGGWGRRDFAFVLDFDHRAVGTVWSDEIPSAMSALPTGRLRACPVETWRGIVRLLDEADIPSWRDFFARPGMCDGWFWELQLMKGTNVVRKLSRSNDAPRKFRKLCQVFRTVNPSVPVDLGDINKFGWEYNYTSEQLDRLFKLREESQIKK